MMKKYRIGRVQQPWINMEPPIRAKKACAETELDEKKDIKSTHDRRSRRSVDLSSVSLSIRACFANKVPGMFLDNC
jgi:delta8-fatty-acid desaturase